MVDLTRRFFLGGALSLLAVQTSAMPKIIGNMPQIWGDGRHDDTGGLNALLRSEPVILPKDRLTVDSHKGITFHRGIFRISRTVEIPNECELQMDHPTFRGVDLASDEPFFRVGLKHQHSFASGPEESMWNVSFVTKHHSGPLIGYSFADADAEEYDGARANATEFVREANGDISWSSKAV